MIVIQETKLLELEGVGTVSRPAQHQTIVGSLTRVALATQPDISFHSAFRGLTGTPMATATAALETSTESLQQRWAYGDVVASRVSEHGCGARDYILFSSMVINCFLQVVLIVSGLADPY